VSGLLQECAVAAPIQAEAAMMPVTSRRHCLGDRWKSMAFVSVLRVRFESNSSAKIQYFFRLQKNEGINLLRMETNSCQLHNWWFILTNCVPPLNGEIRRKLENFNESIHVQNRLVAEKMAVRLEKGHFLTYYYNILFFSVIFVSVSSTL